MFSRKKNLCSNYDGNKGDIVSRVAPSFGRTRNVNFSFKRLFAVEYPFVVQPTRRMVVVDGLAYFFRQKKNKLVNK